MYKILFFYYRDCSLFKVTTNVIESSKWVVFTSDIGGYSNPLAMDYVLLRDWEVSCILLATALKTIDLRLLLLKNNARCCIVRWRRISSCNVQTNSHHDKKTCSNMTSRQHFLPQFESMFCPNSRPH